MYMYFFIIIAWP